MSRKPKLAAVTTLVPKYLREELQSAARSSRRSLSAYTSGILITWYQYHTKHKVAGDISPQERNNEHGKEEKTYRG